MKSALCLSLRLVAIGVALGTAQIVSADSPKAPPFKAIETPEGLEFATVVATDPPYLADSTGQNDATVAIQKAIVDVWRYKGGTVYLPAGKYKILGNLTINPTVTLKGVWEKPTPGQSFGGTILMAYAGRGDANGKPFLQSGLPKDGEAMNLTIWYPEQKPDDIQPYPWTLQGRVSTFRNITLINSYQGIQMIDNSAGVVGDIYGTVLNTGIALMHGSEFPIAYNIDFDSHYWLDAPAPVQPSPLSEKSKASVRKYIDNNLTGIHVGRVDGQALYNARLEGHDPLLIQMSDEEYAAKETPGGHDPKTSPYGFGGIMGKIDGRRVHTGRNSWYFGIHVADLDLIPEVKDKKYDFAVISHPAKTDPSSIFAVRDLRFGALGDGKHDDTDAIQKALLAADANHGGTVYLQQGIYRVTQPLVVPTGVELRGPMDVVQNRAWYDTCTLLIDYGKDAPEPETAPAAVTLNAKSGIQGISFLYSSNQWDVGDDFRPYPYTIRGNGEGVWIVNIFMSNAYNAIDLATNRCDDFVIAGFWAAALHDGIRVGGGSRNGKLERCLMDWGPWPNSHFPKGNKSHAAQTYIYNNATLYSFGDCEHIMAFALCGFYPKRECVFFNQNGRGPSNCEFWMLLFDVPKETAFDCEAGESNSIYGLFATGSGDHGSHNWIEGSNFFKGPLTVYAPTIQPSFVNYAVNLSPSQLRIVYEQSLTTGKPVKATGFEMGHEPEKAVDGDDRTSWQAPEGSSLTVDLGSVKKIRRWVLRNAGYYESPQFNTWSATLEASTDGVTYSEIAKIDKNLHAWIDLPIMPGPVDARYVRLNIGIAANPNTPQLQRKARVYSFDVYE